MLFSLNINDRVRELKRDPIVIKTLHDISLKTSRIWHEFCYNLYLRSFKRHSPGHDKSDVTRSEDDNFFSRHVSFNIYKTLRASCRKNPRRTESGYIKRSSCSLPASHSQDNRLCKYRKHTVFSVHGSNGSVAVYIHDHGSKFIVYTQV